MVQGEGDGCWDGGVWVFGCLVILQSNLTLRKVVMMMMVIMVMMVVMLMVVMMMMMMMIMMMMIMMMMMVVILQRMVGKLKVDYRVVLKRSS